MRTGLRLAVLALLVAGCPSPTSTEDAGQQLPLDFAITASPTAAKIAPGGKAKVTLSTGTFTGPVTFAATDLPLGITAVFTANVLELTAAAEAPSQTASITLTGTSGSLVRTTKLELQIVTGFRPPTAGDPGISVKLDQFFYAEGAKAKVTVNFGAIALPSAVPDIVFSNGESHDAEHVALHLKAGTSLYESDELTVRVGATGTPGDNTLFVAAGTPFFAFYAVDKTQPSLSKIEAALIYDFGFLDGAENPATPNVVNAALALSANELDAGRPRATLLQKDSLPVELATDELIYQSADSEETKRFLEISKGTVIAEQPLELADGGTATSYLISVDTSVVPAARTSLLRAFIGETGELASSRAAGVGIYGLALQYRLDGYAVSVNPRLQYADAPHIDAAEDNNLTHSMKMSGRNGDTTPCLPTADAGNPCVRNVPAMWAYLSLMDKDRERIRVGVLDMGFAPNPDFRPDIDGGFRQCDFTSSRNTCGARAAEGPPTIGASGVGDRLWHGTGVVTTLGGVVNNGWGATGTGGQVAVPMLYKYDLGSYIFEMGLGIRQAVNDGASCINVSASYPCAVVTSVGPDFDVCSAGGRAGICAVVSAAATLAAIAFCTSPLAAIPIAGQIACGALSVAAIGVTSSCISALGINAAIGDVGGPMRSAIQFAVARGVPVISVAGNTLPGDSFPPVVRDYLNLSERRTEAWRIIPAMFPETLVIAAAEENLDNAHFFGDRVDVWAPIQSAYFSPSNVDDPASAVERHDIGGTSAAAPFITGVIANMQAVNPELNPATEGLTTAQRRNIVPRIRSILTGSAATWSNAQLVSLGFANQPVERRKLINPLAAVQAAGAGVLPNLAALGYDDSLNFADPVDPQPIVFDAGVTGTILGIARAEGAAEAADRDVYSFRVPYAFNRVYGNEVRLRWVGDEEPTITPDEGPAWGRVMTTSVGDGQTETLYRPTFLADAGVNFAVSARPGEDMAYKLFVTAPQALTPVVTLTDPVEPATACVGEYVTFRGTATYPGSPYTSSNSIRWQIGSDIGAAGPSMGYTFTTAGTFTMHAEAFTASDSIAVTVTNCTVTARITGPSSNVDEWAPDGDATGPYWPQNFTGQIRDAGGIVIDPTGYTFEWYTDRADLQPGSPTTGQQLLGTGVNLNNVRLYVKPGEVQAIHLVTLVVKQGGIVVGTSSARRFTIHVLI